MNILWIEDFGGKTGSYEDEVHNVFGNILISEECYDEWDDDNNIYRDKGYITKFFTEHSLHRIILQRNYIEFIEFNKDTDLYLELDIIIIDIRLNNTDIPGFDIESNDSLPDAWRSSNSESASKFHEKAGLYIYSMLVQKGYSAKYICLLTGQESTAKEFVVECEKAYIKSPRVFDKSRDIGALQSWIKRIKSSNRIQLKRGILDGIRFCKDLLNDDRNVLFTGLLTGDSRREELKIDKIYLSKYFDAIEANINSIQFCNENNKEVLTILARTILHEWESKIKPKDKDKDKGAKESKCDEQIRWVRALRKFRNKCMHENIFSPWNEWEIGLLFVVSSRLMVKFKDNELEVHEKYLLELCGDEFTRVDFDNFKKTVEEDFSYMSQKGLVSNEGNIFLDKCSDPNVLSENQVKERYFKQFWNEHIKYLIEKMPEDFEKVNVLEQTNSWEYKVMAAISIAY